MSFDDDFPNDTYTLGDTYKEAKKRLKHASIESYEIEARQILDERTASDLSDIITYPNSALTRSEYDNVMCDVHMRISGKPLSRIYKYKEFWGLPFKISEDTLDPRADTETIIEVVLEKFSKKPPKRILDLGTGSGCILLALLSEFPDAHGYGVDLSLGAVNCAKENAKVNQCESRAHFSCGSWLESVEGKFDLIVSNPPYISNQIIPTLSKEVRNHDPILALDGGDDGLSPYKIIFPQIKSFLNPGGIALFEIGYDQEDDVMRLAEESRFAQRCVHMDLAGNPRVVDISCGDK